MSGERPQGVEVVHADGSSVPCELAYLGADDEGIHQWEIATKVNFRDGDILRVDVMPARTSINIPTDDFDNEATA
jgi:hypothetical protein